MRGENDRECQDGKRRMTIQMEREREKERKRRRRKSV